ncbi:hypothetical protein BROUX41_000377 [Berkeleyomyces rouxiae]|uniref:uncharacterized protein n=1 Tax=Berkeleyomyces rouxiae TaxID=2035830 RepID=UPI003B821574
MALAFPVNLPPPSPKPVLPELEFRSGTPFDDFVNSSEAPTSEVSYPYADRYTPSGTRVATPFWMSRSNALSTMTRPVPHGQPGIEAQPFQMWPGLHRGPFTSSEKLSYVGSSSCLENEGLLSIDTATLSLSSIDLGTRLRAMAHFARPVVIDKKAIIVVARSGTNAVDVVTVWSKLRDSGISVFFATPDGDSPKCNTEFLTPWKLYLARLPQYLVESYNQMLKDINCMAPDSWDYPDFNLLSYDLAFIPGCTGQGFREMRDNCYLRGALRAFFPLTRRSTNTAHPRILGAIGQAAATVPRAADYLGRILGQLKMCAHHADLKWDRSMRHELLSHQHCSFSQFKDQGFIPWRHCCEDNTFAFISGRFMLDAFSVANSMIKNLFESACPDSASGFYPLTRQRPFSSAEAALRSNMFNIGIIRP